MGDRRVSPARPMGGRHVEKFDPANRLPTRVRPLANPKPTRAPGPTPMTSRIRPLIREDYPLSLSISLSGGEETNQDFPSNGERTGNSPA